MADVERALLGRAISSGELDELIARGIEPEHFGDESNASVYKTMLNHSSRYGTHPTHEAVRDAHPNFPMYISEESLDYLIDRFVRAVKRRKAVELYRDFGAACDDPERVLDIEVVAMEMASTLMDIVPTTRLGRYSESENRIEEYLRRRATGESSGIETGFPSIDYHIIGIQDHEFAVVAGFQNSGKSMVMQRMAWNMYNQGRTPLYITLEMSEDECYGRWDTMATGMEHRALRNLEYAEDAPEIQRWKEEAQRAKDFRPDRDLMVLDNIGSCTPDRVLAETRRTSPDAVFVDYLELMDSPRSSESEWQGIDQIGRQLKRNARVGINGKNIPVIVAAQTNAQDGGSGAELSNISYKSTGKHADIVLGITRTDDMAAEKRMELWILKNRNGARNHHQELICDPSHMQLDPSSISTTMFKKYIPGQADIDDDGSLSPYNFGNK